MPKNIVIFSDGTGQRGGVNFDENRSNVYKLYRATRVGPDSCIDPTQQVAYYDPGIGTAPPGLGLVGTLWRRFQNLVSQATGLGLTINIIDSYVEILRVWEPGDRIYLIGFSRGAYTVRCLAAVLGLCGVPTLDETGNLLRRDTASLKAIAVKAVKKVYQHVSSPKDVKFKDQRAALGKQFRERYASQDAYPYFIGVFDTVAAVAAKESVLLLGMMLSVAYLVIGGALGWWLDSFWLGYRYVGLISVIALVIGLLATNLKFAVGLPEHPFLKTVHVTKPVMRFADKQLSDKVEFARHALSIDEMRASFDRVPWGNVTQWKPNWLKQIWFAGNHSDIGGSYTESESRLSDIALGWMVDQIKGLPEPLFFDDAVIRIYPVSSGIQHDECRSNIAFRHAAKAKRKIVWDAVLHPTVLERFKLPRVLQYDVMKSYRPEALRDHNAVYLLYAQQPPVEERPDQDGKRRYDGRGCIIER